MQNVIVLLCCSIVLVSCNHRETGQHIDSKIMDTFFQKSDFVENFDSCKSYSLPIGWFTAATGKNKPGKWKLIEDLDGKLVGQVSDDGSGYLFNLLVLSKPELKDLAISVRFKAVAGKEDQGGGLVWRYQDSANYYVARANPLENNFRVYKVINGNREQIQSYSLPVTASEWHSIAIIHRDSLIECYFEHQLFLKAIDNDISLPGKIGFWTKADAQTHFDNLKIKEFN